MYLVNKMKDQFHCKTQEKQRAFVLLQCAEGAVNCCWSTEVSLSEQSYCVAIMTFLNWGFPENSCSFNKKGKILKTCFHFELKIC